MITFLWLAVLVVALPVVQAGETPPAPAADADAPQGDRWQFELSPMYLWAIGVEGDVGIGSISAPVDSSFSDVLDTVEFAGTARFEGQKGRWGFFVDASYFELANEMDGPSLPLDLKPPKFTPSGRLREVLSQLPPPLRAKVLRRILSRIKAAKGKLSSLKMPSIDEIDVDLTLALVEAGPSYRFFECPLGEAGVRQFSMEAYGGCRYTYMKVEQDIHIDRGSFKMLPSRVSIEESTDWLEPLIGARLKYDITERLNFSVRGDAGGFGIGSASELTWQLVAGLQYRMTELLSLYAGYKHYELDYEKGNLDMDLQLSGPIFGLAFHF